MRRSPAALLLVAALVGPRAAFADPPADASAPVPRPFAPIPPASPIDALSLAPPDMLARQVVLGIVPAPPAPPRRAPGATVGVVLLTVAGVSVALGAGMLVWGEVANSNCSGFCLDGVGPFVSGLFHVGTGVLVAIPGAVLVGVYGGRTQEPRPKGPVVPSLDSVVVPF